MRPVALAEGVEESAYGGKAAQLAAAIRDDLPVPGGVALPTGFVDAVIAGRPGTIRELAEICATLGCPVAVRSSAVGEDSETASFAGQHLTCLNIRPSPPALAEAVRAIWQSAHSESALAYRRRLGLSREPRIGVVVQELVVADCAGVLFTRNPFDGVDEIVIEASWGFGESIVAGLVTPDRFRLSREGTVLERTPGTKDLAVRVLPEGGTYEAEIPAELVRTLCLDDARLRELHVLARRCEKTFSGTQDLEWAFAGGTLYLLQRRAVTRGLADAEQQGHSNKLALGGCGNEGRTCGW
jgi:pyruvate, water dikinase